MLGAAGDVGGDVGLPELVAQQLGGALDLHLPVGAAVGDHRLDLGVLARVEDLERQVLELPLDGVDAEPVRERRVDLERLLRLLRLLLTAEVLDRAHVVEPVGELDQDDAHVLRHRDDHLPVVLRLRLLAARELDARELRDALDEEGDLGAEVGADLLRPGRRVLDDVVEERSGDRLLVEVELGADLRDAPRVPDELLARLPQLTVVVRLGVLERAADQLLVDPGVVRLDRGEELLDEVLVVAVGVDDGHGGSLLSELLHRIGRSGPEREPHALAAARVRDSPAAARPVLRRAPLGTTRALLTAYAARRRSPSRSPASRARNVGDSSSCRFPEASSRRSSAKIARASGVQAASPARHCSRSQVRRAS